MNAGNKTRGQADGYLLDALGKTLTIKDANGTNMLTFICKILYEEDEEIMNIKQIMEPCYVCLKVVLDDIKKDFERSKKELASSKSQLDMIMKIDPDAEDSTFGKQLSRFMTECEPLIEKIKGKMDKMDGSFTQTCDFFMIGKNDEMRQKSEKFFRFFTDFFDEVNKYLPKIEKKPAKSKAKAAANKAGHAAMMAELAAKMKK